MLQWPMYQFCFHSLVNAVRPVYAITGHPNKKETLAFCGFCVFLQDLTVYVTAEYYNT